MKKIPRNARILSVSHNDMDGAGCQILLGSIYKNIDYMNFAYGDVVDKGLMAIDGDAYDYIFVTDISPKIEEVLDRFDNLILIDHHQNAKNNPKKNRFVNKNYSATFLTHHFLKKMYGEERMKPYTKLVKIINDYDMWKLKYKGSIYMNYIYGLYNMEKFRERFKDGDIKLTKKENDYIRQKVKEFDEQYEELEIYEFDDINACMFQSNVFINEFSHRLMNEEGYDVVFFNTTKNYKLAIRSSIDFNFGEYFREKGIGGGHEKAAGIDTQSEEAMQETLDKLEKDLYKDIPSIRR